MKKFILFISVLFIACACSSLEYERETSPPHASIVTKSASGLKSSDNLFFHPQSGLYISQNRDAIDFFESASVNSLQPTHIAVKFFPKDEEEKRAVLCLDGAHVSYIPFGYDPVDPNAYESLDLGQIKIFRESGVKMKAVTPKILHHRQMSGKSIGLLTTTIIHHMRFPREQPVMSMVSRFTSKAILI